jgi:hypothetical protein
VPAATFRLVINEVGWGGRRPRVVRAIVRPGDAAEESRVTPGVGLADEFLAEVFRAVNARGSRQNELTISRLFISAVIPTRSLGL